jgi:hypothetical protein
MCARHALQCARYARYATCATCATCANARMRERRRAGATPPFVKLVKALGQKRLRSVWTRLVKNEVQDNQYDQRNAEKPAE